MYMKKVYISKTGTVYAFPVTIKKGDKELHPFIEFGNDLKFETSTKAIQDSIEQTDYFKRGRIGLLSTLECEEEDKTDAGENTDKGTKNTKVQGKQNAQFEPKAYDNVTDINGAVDILKGEPYKINVKSLRTPENIMKQAQACNVTFPNWKLD